MAIYKDPNHALAIALSNYADDAVHGDRDEEADAAYVLVRLKNRLDTEEIRSLATILQILATKLDEKTREIGWNS